MRVSTTFIVLALVGVGEALYHAWSENAFSTNWASVSFSPYASFYGIPYWVFGVVWFPLTLVVGLWATRYGRLALPAILLIPLSLGNLFTAYLWYLDLNVIGSFTAAYVGLYVTNYALTGLVVMQNWHNRAMREFTAGTGIGLVAGVFFGGFGMVIFGLLGGYFGAIGGYTASKS
jgi:uncharacterized membrane protein